MIENQRRNRDAVAALFGMLLFPIAILFILVLITGGQGRTDTVLAAIGGVAIFQLSHRWTPLLFRKLWPIAGDEPAAKERPKSDIDPDLA